MSLSYLVHLVHEVAGFAALENDNDQKLTTTTLTRLLISRAVPDVNAAFSRAATKVRSVYVSTGTQEYSGDNEKRYNSNYG